MTANIQAAFITVHVVQACLSSKECMLKTPTCLLSQELNPKTKVCFYLIFCHSISISSQSFSASCLCSSDTSNKASEISVQCLKPYIPCRAPKV